MVLIKSEPLEPEVEGYFGRKWKRQDTYDCKHGEQVIVNESGWMCYGAYQTCTCCGDRYCYVDSTLGEKQVYTMELCRFCYEVSNG